MGTLTQAQLNAEIRAGLGNRTDVTDSRITAGLNIAQARVSRFWDFQELKLTATANNTKDPGGNLSLDKYLRVPSNLKTVHSLVLQDEANSRKLVEKPWRMFDELFPFPENDPPDRSVLYSRWGYLFILYPIPDNVYKFQLKYTARPTPFGVMDTTAQTGALTQVSDFEEKDDILINLTLEYFHRSFGRVDKADTFLKMAYGDLEIAKKKDDDRPDMSVSRENLGMYVEGSYWLNPWVKSVQIIGGP